MVVRVIPGDPRAVVYEISRGEQDKPKTVHIDNLREWYGWKEIEKWWQPEDTGGITFESDGEDTEEEEARNIGPADLAGIVEYHSLIREVAEGDKSVPSAEVTLPSPVKMSPEWYSAGPSKSPSPPGSVVESVEDRDSVIRNLLEKLSGAESVSTLEADIKKASRYTY